jgi:predicted RNA-binding protein YlxR (DUF448 family)
VGRGGRTKDRVEVERRCIAKGETLPTSLMLRFVISPDGVVTPDVAGKLPGRGIWVTNDHETLAHAIDKKLFSKSAKAQVTIPDGLLELVEQMLIKKVIDTLSMCQKGGRVVVGFDKTKSALVSEKASVLIQANDGSEGQKAKLRPPEGKDTLISCLNAYELGLAFGREHVIHAALERGGLMKTARLHANRLSTYRGIGSMLEQHEQDSQNRLARKR